MAKAKTVKTVPKKSGAPKKPKTSPLPNVGAALAPVAASANVPKVRVRMFRQGLGDCFLLTLDVGGTERHMLIDCGTLGNKNTTVKIDDVARHIFETIGSGHLDLVVATHEHHDHLSGFN